MKLQKAETERQTGGNGKTSLIIPARMIGTEQQRVTRTVNAILKTSVIAASILDIMAFSISNWKKT